VILTPLSVNLDQLDPVQAVRPAAALLILAAAGMLLVYTFARDWQYAGYLVFLVYLFFFSFGHVVRFSLEQFPILYELQYQLVFLVAWLLILAVLCLKPVWSRLKRLVWLTPFLNLLFLVALAGPVYSTIHQALPGITADKAVASASEVGSEDHPIDCSASPDIYYIILDGYARSDVLQERYGIDNQPFLDYLHGKGFFVADESYSNYMQTIFSVASSLNFEYIDPPSGLQQDGAYFKAWIAHNALRQLLRQCGYRFIINQSGFYFTDDLAPDAVLSPWSSLTEFEGLLLAGSPYEILAHRLNFELNPQSFAAHRQRIRDSFAGLQEAYRLPGPKLVFAHIVSPHPPFVFDADGLEIQPAYPYSMNDGDDFKGTPEEYRDGYPKQVQFVNRQVQQVVDSLLANSETPPVIIIQADHGPGLGLDWDSPDNTCLWERTSILNAYYLPGIEADELYPSISPVNSFRVVLNQYFGTDLPLLADDTYFTSHRLTRQVIDITDRRTSRENCALLLAE
jgi:hypothetical protein